MAFTTRDRDIDNDILNRVNWLLQYTDSPNIVQSVDELDLCHFVSIFKMLTGETIPGWASARTLREKTNMCQFLINTLADDVFGISLDHINGHDVMMGKRRSINDLLEIFTELTDFINRTPLSDIHLNDENEDEQHEDGEINGVPPSIRNMLHKIESDAQSMFRSQSDKKSRFPDKVVDIRSECTQTTPKHMVSSTTSPITWATLLCENYSKHENKRNIDRLDLFRSLPNHINREKTSNPNVCEFRRNNLPKNQAIIKNVSAVKSNIKPVVKSKIIPPVRTSAPKKIVKPKKVLGSKVRRNSSSRGKTVDVLGSTNITRSPGAQDKNECVFPSRDIQNTEHLLKLLDHAEKIRSRRREISRQLKELQEEDIILKKMEVIMLKEIRLTQNMKTGNKARKMIPTR